MELMVKIRKRLRNFELAADFMVRDEVFALLGASGCGKSMTLKCIAGIEQPDSGRIVLDGRVLYDSEAGINLRPQQRRVGYLFQNYALFPNMTIGENIRFAASGSREQREQKVQDNLRRFSLAELAGAYPHELSGGQQQRAAFARILSSDAGLLLLDEPFSALDSYLRWQLELELSEVLQAYDGMALLVSHDRGEVYRLADRVAVIDRGKMETAYTKHELFQHPDTLAATLLTGCKNVSLVQRVDQHRVIADDWQLELMTEQIVPDKVRYAGIRAHYIEVKAAAGVNTFCMEVVKVIEDTFSYLIMIRRQGTRAKPIRWELDKSAWHSIVAAQLYLYFPPDKIMLMEH